MNVFALDEVPFYAAKYHADVHVGKMLVELGQLMSTAHRVLDGEQHVETVTSPKTGKVCKIKRWRLDPERDAVFYKASHVNHPSARWIRETADNYWWAYLLFCGLAFQFAHRYDKEHLTATKLQGYLKSLPQNIPVGARTPFALAMPPALQISDDPVECYRRYYVSKAGSMKMRWTKTKPPPWFPKHLVTRPNQRAIALDDLSPPDRSALADLMQEELDLGF